MMFYVSTCALTILNKRQDSKLTRGQQRPPVYSTNARILPLPLQKHPPTHRSTHLPPPHPSLFAIYQVCLSAGCSQVFLRDPTLSLCKSNYANSIVNVAHANGGKNSFSRAPVVTAVFTQTKSLHSWLEGGILPVLGTRGFSCGRQWCKRFSDSTRLQSRIDVSFAQFGGVGLGAKTVHHTFVFPFRLCVNELTSLLVST